MRRPWPVAPVLVLLFAACCVGWTVVCFTTRHYVDGAVSAATSLLVWAVAVPGSIAAHRRKVNAWLAAGHERAYAEVVAILDRGRES